MTLGRIYNFVKFRSLFQPRSRSDPLYTIMPHKRILHISLLKFCEFKHFHKCWEFINEYLFILTYPMSYHNSYATLSLLEVNTVRLGTMEIVENIVERIFYVWYCGEVQTCSCRPRTTLILTAPIGYTYL